MKPAPVVPQVALIVRWPHESTAGPAAQQLLKQLGEHRLTATWAIEQPAQAERLLSGSRGIVDAALLVRPTVAAVASKSDPAEDFAYEVRRDLEDLRGAGVEASAIYLGRELSRGVHERRLRGLGVRSIILGGASRSSAPRALPFGLWQVSPSVSVPVVSTWKRLLGWKRSVRITPVDGQPTVAAIDLASVGSVGSRTWQSVEKFLTQLAEAQRGGKAAVGTVSQLVGGVAESSAARPQRSILRGAA